MELQQEAGFPTLKSSSTRLHNAKILGQEREDGQSPGRYIADIMW